MRSLGVPIWNIAWNAIDIVLVNVFKMLEDWLQEAVTR